MCVLSFPFRPFAEIRKAGTKLQACQENQVAPKVLEFSLSTRVEKPGKLRTAENRQAGGERGTKGVVPLAGRAQGLRGIRPQRKLQDVCVRVEGGGVKRGKGETAAPTTSHTCLGQLVPRLEPESPGRLFKIYIFFIYLFLERGKGRRKRGRETSM